MANCAQCDAPLLEGPAAGLCSRCLGQFTLGDQLPEKRTTGPKTHAFGDYEILNEIARGGMGVVYRARQISLNRVVALKVVLHGPFASDEARRRFRTEAQAVAGLRHPNIVSIYEAGEHDGNPYLAMEYVEGTNLAVLANGKALPAHRAADYLRVIAEGVRHAHESGVLHRDLKPSNVLLDVQEQPRITDFGLAKLLNSDAELTNTGDVLGSPAYIPPEQALSGFREVGPAGDIYSLGAILYHLLTGKPPFQGETVQEVLMQVAASEPRPPRELNSSMPLDLQTICLKCLQKEPRQRYASADQVADELQRFLNGEPIRARPVGWLEQTYRWCRRKPALASTLGVAIVSLLVIAIGSPIAVMRLDRERRAAEAARRQELGSRVRAEAAEQASRQQAFAALVSQARATVRSGEMGQRVQALEALKNAAAISNTVELRRDAFAALALPDLRLIRELDWGPEYTVRRLDPMFERIALCRLDGPVEIRSVLNREILSVLPATTNLPAFSDTRWSRDGRNLAVKRDRNTEKALAEWEIWDLSAAKPRLTLVIHDAFLEAVAFHPDGKRIAAATVDKSVVFYELASGSLVSRFALTNSAFHLIFDPGGTRFATTQQSPAGSLLTIHSATDGQFLHSLLFSNHPNHLDWSPDGKWISVPDNSGKLTLVGAETGESVILGRHKSVAMDALFTAESAYLLTSGWGYEVLCWDAHAMRRAMTVPTPGYNLQMRADSRACSMETEAGVQVYEFSAPAGCREFREDLGGRVNAAAISSDGRWLAASGGARMGVWDLANEGPGALTRGGRDLRLSFGANGELFTDQRGNCSRWQVSAAAAPNEAPHLERLPLAVPRGFVSLSLSSNRIVMSGAKGSAVVSGDEMEQQPVSWKPTVSGLNHVSADGRWLGMFESYSPDLLIYKLPGMEPVAKFHGAANIADFAFSPTGDEVATGTDSGVEFWSTSNWNRLRSAPKFSSVVYAPDGKTFFLGSEWGSGLYRSVTLEPLLPFPPGVVPLAMSQDGRRVVLSVNGDRLQLWDMAEIRKQLRQLKMDWEDSVAQAR
jgi:WD40 repeat protein/predicted Ser/Thr protein kinase